MFSNEKTESNEREVANTGGPVAKDSTTQTPAMAPTIAPPVAPPVPLRVPRPVVMTMVQPRCQYGSPCPINQSYCPYGRANHPTQYVVRASLADRMYRPPSSISRCQMTTVLCFTAFLPLVLVLVLFYLTVWRTHFLDETD
ncbi:uncharacterized protein LOC124169160 [Ischnura elegans]|uniref:uncharacterized protein LOC124169160 n=1 Tax=Ischnura elegans TaxID=197161 RepID=UPI001ED89851|nr:uncharacterized protein LOC124169160 [Ischnura elegans]